MLKEHQGIINSICRIYYRDEEDFKDARQDVILQLWKSLPTFRSESKMSTWIYKVTLNTILAKISKEKKMPLSESLSDAYPYYNQAGNFEPDVDLQQLLYLIHKMEEIDKAIMILHLEGYSHKEIAGTLKLTATNISTRISRIKIRLKETFKNI
ncbi:RNA polymerase sigma factor [Dyadobacter bucti]|uniref:RNA polymerase sigma factor n=1 Tax=Dyadobacter bucti TaxID=2572203 RepID=UPI00140BCC8B|nr:sigma-70 family RNA polymerase sigma factor [Dyadobacter bucti]